MPILTILILLPLLGAVLIGLLARGERAAHLSRWAALIITLAELAIALCALSRFDMGDDGFQLVEKARWFGGYNISYHLGVDGISLAMILLTAALMPLCILCSWRSVTQRVPMYMATFLLLESLIMGVFAALDLLVFYIFFEAVLIPMYLIIGVWGGEKRIYAAYKFFLYTLAGSVLFLLAMLYLYFTFGTTDIPTLTEQTSDLSLDVQKWLWLAMFASFAVKVPMWPFHTWLPDAHVQAPTAGSVILAGILLKLGAYGFLRFSLPMLPDASHAFAPLMYVLSVVAVVYTSLVALVQEDMKKLIAYSSVAHMGFVTLGIFSFTEQGIQGAIFQMISHGIVSGALFLCVGVLYDRMHTKSINAYGGVTQVMPRFAVAFMLFTMASAGLPATSGFVGEILVLVGSFQASQWATLGAATGLVLGAAYMLWLYRRVMFGPVGNHEVEGLRDLSTREHLVFLPLILGVLWLGVYPSPTLKLLEVPTLQLLAQTGSVTGASAPAAEKDEGKDKQPADHEELEHKADQPRDKHKAHDGRKADQQHRRVESGLHIPSPVSSIIPSPQPKA